MYAYFDPYRVTLFGHRYIDRFREVDEELDRVLNELVLKHPYIDFYIGNDGDFDRMATSAIRRLIQRCGKENITINLVFAYPKADIDMLEHGIEDTVFLCHLLELLKIVPLEGIHLQRLTGTKHIGQSFLAPCLVLLLVNGIQENSRIFCSAACELDEDLRAFQRHPHNLLGSFSGCVHLSVFSFFYCNKKFYRNKKAPESSEA